MKKFRGLFYLLFILLMITSPLFVSVEANYVPAQAAPTFSGELIPDPYFTQEPDFVIGLSSPEFGYAYSFTGGAGSVDLVWTHSAGYRPVFDGYYPRICEEYAAVFQTFDMDYNEPFQAVKISASIEIDCTGDFAAEDVLDRMWEVHIGLLNPYTSEPHPLRAITGLKDGDNEDLSFILTESETMSIFYSGAIGQFGLSVKLVPAPLFDELIGEIVPWNDYSGSVILTLDYLSFQIMLEGDSLAPPIKSPRYNTTDSPENQRNIMGIESGGYDIIQQLRAGTYSIVGQELTLCRLLSNHEQLGNKTLYQEGGLLGFTNFAVSNNRVAFFDMVTHDEGYDAEILCYDSLGNWLWNSIQGLYFQDIPFLADFDSAGNLVVFVLSLRTFDNLYDSELMYSLLKVDNLGNRIWNKTIWIREYSEYVQMGGDLGIPTGFGCTGDGVYIGVDDKIQKYDTSGNLLWSNDFPHLSLCVDPQEGVYTYSQEYSFKTELTRWNTYGSKAWVMNLGWDYGSGWVDYPEVEVMEVGPSGPLHLVLRYAHVHSTLLLTRITRTGQILSEDTLFTRGERMYYYHYLPYITDMAITGNGLVHIIGAKEYSPYGYPFITIPATFLLTYDLPPVSTFNPITIAMVGVAGILFIGIAYDYFFRREKVPEPPEEPSISDFEW